MSRINKILQPLSQWELSSHPNPFMLFGQLHPRLNPLIGKFIQSLKNSHRRKHGITNFVLVFCFSPTLDQCRAPPCDNPGECRSGLGFCGTGVVYCNSMSSFKPECIGGVSQLETSSRTPQPTFANKGGPPSLSPTTKWQSWVQANYGSDTSAPVTTQEHIGDEAVKSHQTTVDGDESSWVGFTDTPQPSNEPVTDPFSWVSGGTFDGDTYTSYTDSDSPWWSQAQTTSDASNVSCQITMTIVGTLIILQQ